MDSPQSTHTRPDDTNLERDRFVQEHQEATAECLHDVKQTIDDVKLAKQIAEQEMFDNQNRANTEWRNLSDKGEGTRALNNSKTRQKLKNIKDETDQFMSAQAAELAKYNSLKIQETQEMEAIAEQSRQENEKSRTSKMSEIHEESRKFEAKTQKQISEDRFKTGETLKENFNRGEEQRSSLKSSYEMEMERMEAEFNRKMELELQKQLNFQNKSKAKEKSWTRKYF